MMVQSGVLSASMFALPTRKRATSSMGRCVADKPMRINGISISISDFEFVCELSAVADQLFQAFDGEREMRAAFVADYRMNLVND